MEWHIGTQYTNWQTKGNAAKEHLEDVDWDEQYWAVSHPTRVKIERYALVDYDSGRVIARTEPGYSFYFGHDHIHVCPENWDNRSYPDGWPDGPIFEKEKLKWL